MRRRSATCSARSTRWRSGCRASAIWSGRQITEADWRLFVTLVRFDAAYYGQFKCNLRRLSDYPNLSNYLRDLYSVPGVAATVDLAHIKHGYYRQRPDRNPSGVVPLGPALDFSRRMTARGLRPSRSASWPTAR